MMSFIWMLFSEKSCPTSTSVHIRAALLSIGLLMDWRLESMTVFNVSVIWILVLDMVTLHHELYEHLVCSTDDCGFFGGGGFQKHIKEHHEEVRERPCPHPGCNKVFMIDRYLQRHVKLIHTGEVRRRVYGSNRLGITWCSREDR